MEVVGKKKLELQFAQFQFEKCHLHPRRSELDNYLEDALVDLNEENFDILQ